MLLYLSWKRLMMHHVSPFFYIYIFLGLFVCGCHQLSAPEWSLWSLKSTGLSFFSPPSWRSALWRCGASHGTAGSLNQPGGYKVWQTNVWNGRVESFKHTFRSHSTHPTFGNGSCACRQTAEQKISICVSQLSPSYVRGPRC